MRFPIFALLAPIVTSVILWLVTGSAYTLLFALLGPIMALAQFADGKLQARKSEKLKQENATLKTMLEYMPNGRGYETAKQNFEELATKN